MTLARRHTFQVVTKRPKRLAVMPHASHPHAPPGRSDSAVSCAMEYDTAAAPLVRRLPGAGGYFGG